MVLLLAVLATASAASPPREPITTHVQSDKLDIRRRPEGRVDEFTGNVRYRREGVAARADWAQYDHAAELLKARGDARASRTLRDGSVVEVRGQAGEHSERTGQGALRGRTSAEAVQFAVDAPGGRRRGSGSARELRWNLQAQTALAEGEVRFDDERGSVRAERALYEHGPRTVTFEGRRPVATAREPGWSAAVQAQTLELHEGEAGRRRVIGAGGARGWIVFEKKPAGRR